MSRSNPSKARRDSTATTDSSIAPGSSRLAIPGTSRPSPRVSSSGSSVYSLSPTSRRHLTPLTSPAPSTSTTSLSPSHARPSGPSSSTATSRLRSVASNASIRLDLGSRLSRVVSTSISASPSTDRPGQSMSSPQNSTGESDSATSPPSASSDTTVVPPSRADDATAEADETTAMPLKRKTSPNTSTAPDAANARRRTWFGFGSTIGPSPRLNAGDEKDKGNAEIPAPMDADEAAFRLALGSGMGAGIREETPNPSQTRSRKENGEAITGHVQTRASANTDLDTQSLGTSTSSEPSRAPQAASRTTNSRGWFTWRAQAQTPGSAPSTSNQDQSSPQENSASFTAQVAATSTSASSSLQPPASSGGRISTQSAQPSYSSPLRRMWNRSETVAENPAEETAATDAPSSPAPEDAPPASQPAPTNAGSAPTWRFSLWPVPTPAPTTDAQSAQTPQQTGQVPSASAAGAPFEHPMTTEDSGKGEIESRAETSLPGSDGQAGYASYITSWIPGWGSVNSVLNLSATDPQQPEITSAAASGEVPFAPRTPAEQVKADALARSEKTTQVLSAVTDGIQKLADPSDAILNSATRKTWVSYFSTRRAANPQKRITDAATAESGPEVMDLDESGPSSLQVPSTSTERSASPSLAESAPAVLRTTKTSDGAGSKNAATTAAAKAQKAGARIVRSNRSPNSSIPASPVIAAADKQPVSPSASDISRGGANDSKTKVSIPAAIKHKLSAASLSSKANSDPAPTGSPSPTWGTDNKSQTVKGGRKGSLVPVKAPNLVLPSFEDTFSTPPRVWAPKVSVFERTIQAFNTYLFSKPPDYQRLNASAASNAANTSATAAGKRPRRGSNVIWHEAAQRLPRSWEVMGDKARASQRGVGSVQKIVVIGVHGWFAQFKILKNVMGEPTGTSFKFAKEMSDAVRRHFKDAGWELNPEAITMIALEGDGKVADRVHRLSVSILSNPEWVKSLHEADAILFSVHSQGTVVATELLARLIEQKHIVPERTRVCLLAMAGIHEGPLPNLQSALISSYLTYFETAAAKELFEYMSSGTSCSESYATAVRIILAAGVKAVYVASVDDQVVPLHGALHSAISHPSILRALYIDGQAFPRADFLTNLLVLCTQVRNAGLNDHDVLSLLSATVAGSLYNGLGHSNVYEETAVYDLAVRYLFETTHPCAEPTCSTDHKTTMPAVERKPFEVQVQSPYALPWAIRGLLEDPDELLEEFAVWKPTSKAQKDVQLRLSPLKNLQLPGARQRTTSASNPSSPQIPSNSKL
ncbi:hypothetical protein OC861_000810 [Tilletia horrida]|nr:hypothetical protein OC861_000810 [Tilletia horrida]